MCLARSVFENRNVETFREREGGGGVVMMVAMRMVGARVY